MARSTGAAPRQRGNKEKWTLIIPAGGISNTRRGRTTPKATATASSAGCARRASPAACASSASATGRPSPDAARFTGEGEVLRPRPRARSGRVITSRTSPIRCRARRQGAAARGVPKKARVVTLAARSPGCATPAGPPCGRAAPASPKATSRSGDPTHAAAPAPANHPRRTQSGSPQGRNR